ncbi:MAG: hypothetical protein WCQ41_01370 [Bacillota bacterium]
MTNKKRLGTEVLLGGFFGIIAVVATFLEMMENGLTTASIYGGIKDVAGTMVAIMVFLIAIRGLIPKKEKLTFEEKLMAALSDWQKSNSTLILKSTDDEKTYKYGFSMRTDINDFYRSNPLTKNVGWFVRLPLISKEQYANEFEIIFHLNKGTFFEGVQLSEAELKQKYSVLSQKFCEFIGPSYVGFAKPTAKFDEIFVKVQPLTTDEDIKKLINMLNSMFQAFLASANIKIE